MAGNATYPSLRDRVVFVSGGSSGIGACLVEEFAAQGARVAFIDIDASAAEQTVEAAAPRGPRPLFLKCDARDIAALQAAIAETGERLGPVRALMNNAANDQRHAVDTVTPEFWDERLQINLRHQFFAAQAVFPMMRDAGGGSIVNFGSISWMIGQGGMPTYTTSKSAVHGLTRGLARDFGPANVRVNTLAPGWIMTQRQIDLWLTAEGEAELMQRQCLKRKLVPLDVARMALFLASDEASACTAQTFIVDGGWA